MPVPPMPLRRAVSPGFVLAQLTVAPVLVLVAWLLVSLPLLLAGVFRPAWALGFFVPVVAAVGWVALRRVPRWLEAPWWSVAAVVGIAVGFGVLQGAMVSEQIIVRRDPASYVQFAVWIAEHGSLPIPQFREAFGDDPALSYESAAFYARSGSIVPQFMAGLPLTLAAAHWLGGLTGVLMAAPVLGALAVLTFAGLVARLVGSRWAPVGALALALTLPQMFVSRSTYSETVAQLMLLGGLALLVDALGLENRSDRPTAALAGAALGLAVLARIDGLRDVLPVAAYAGLLAVRRRPEAAPLAGGLTLGVGYGLADGFLLSRPYLEHLSDAVRPLFAISATVVLVTSVAVAVLRFRGRGPPRPGAAGRWVPGGAGLLVAAGVVGLAARPYLQTVRGEEHDQTARFIAAVQRIEGLPIDPTRQYYEYSLHWVAWYAGVPAVILGALGAALLTRRVLRGRAHLWTLSLAVLGWSAATTLWQPLITPDHPWASRRLVPTILPAVIILAVWAVGWLVQKAQNRAYGRPAVWAIGAAGVAAVAVPPLFTSAAAVAEPIEQREVAAVRGLCRAIGPNASAVIVDGTTGQRFSQVIRGMCGTPAASLPEPTPEALTRVRNRIEASGRRPVLLGRDAEDVRWFPDLRPRHVLHLDTRQDAHTLSKPPDGTWRLVFDVWLAAPPPESR